jgi:hypothetical protein
LFANAILDIVTAQLCFCANQKTFEEGENVREREEERRKK